MQYRFLSALAGLATLSACVPAREVTAPTIQTLRVPGTPTQVVQRTATQLTLDGFQIGVADATGGILTARGGGMSPEIVACKWPEKTIQYEAHISTVSLTQSTRSVPGTDSSDVTLRLNVHTEYPRLANPPSLLSLPPSETDCVSTGAEETKLVTILRQAR